MNGAAQYLYTFLYTDSKVKLEQASVLSGSTGGHPDSKPPLPSITGGKSTSRTVALSGIYMDAGHTLAVINQNYISNGLILAPRKGSTVFN